MAGNAHEELCDLLRPVVRRQVQEALGNNELHYDTGELLHVIVSNPDVVLRALGGEPIAVLDGQEHWSFPMGGN